MKWVQCHNWLRLLSQLLYIALLLNISVGARTHYVSAIVKKRVLKKDTVNATDKEYAHIALKS